jgi:hypothetical protein
VLDFCSHIFPLVFALRRVQNYSGVGITMNAYASYEEWTLQVLLALTGEGMVFTNGHEAIRDCNYRLLRKLYNKNLTQYEASEEYKGSTENAIH